MWRPWGGAILIKMFKLVRKEGRRGAGRETEEGGVGNKVEEEKGEKGRPSPWRSSKVIWWGTSQEKAFREESTRLETLCISALTLLRWNAPLSPPCGDQHYQVQPGICRAQLNRIADTRQLNTTWTRRYSHSLKGVCGKH